MVDVDTFLTILYVIADDFCQSHPPKRRPGPQPSLSEGEVIALALFARWGRFSSERDFYRYAEARLRDAFPTLPDRGSSRKRSRRSLASSKSERPRTTTPSFREAQALTRWP
jgi:hypothetical protein